MKFSKLNALKFDSTNLTVTKQLLFSRMECEVNVIYHITPEAYGIGVKFNLACFQLKCLQS